MAEQLRFKSAVLLVDARYLLEDVAQIKRQLQERMGRPEVQGDLVQLFTLLLLDAGFQAAPGIGVQVILLQDRKDSIRSMPLEPARVASLDGMATMTQIGEMSFMVLEISENFSREDLYHDVLGLALTAKEVEHLILLPLALEDGGDEGVRQVFASLIKELELKSVPDKGVLFTLYPKPSATLREEPLAAPLAYAFGYRFQN